MTPRWIPTALGAWALAFAAGNAHAAWGHSDCAHVRAYRHLDVFAGPGTDAAASVQSGALSGDAPAIRALDDAAVPAQPRKAHRGVDAAAPARS
ncbi:MAG: hypothetical protein AB1482_00845 [Pseudomonadota bacterium]